MILVACGSAPTAPVAAVVAPTVATVTTTFGAVTGLAGGQATAPITVTAVDINGNPVANAPVSVAINGTLVGGVPTLVAGAVTNVSGFTGPTGKATLTITYLVAPGLTATATAGGIASPAVATPTPVVARIIANNVPASNVVADGYSSYALTAYLYDAGNNLISGETVTFSTTSLQNGQAALSATTATSGVTGAVVVNVSDTSSIDDTVTVLVHALSDTYGAADYRAALTFTGSGTGSNPASNGDTLRIVSVLPPTVPADGATAVVIKVQARDVYSQIVAGMPIRMTSTLNAVVTPALANSDVYGFASFQVVDQYAETITLTAGKNGVLPVSAAQGVVFTPYASTLTITALNNKTNIIANGVDTTTLTITATGPNGLVPGERIRLSSSSNNTQLPALLVTTGTNGQATTTVSDAVAEGMTITATTRDGGLLPGTTVSQSIDLYAALAAPTMIFSPTSSFLADNATAGHPITLTIKNNAGVVQPNQPVTFSLSTATAGVASQPSAQSGGTNPTVWSDANGVINLFVSDSVAELVTLTATAVDGTVSTTPIQFTTPLADSVALTLSTTATVPNTLITATAVALNAAKATLANAWVQFDIYTAAGTHIGPISALSGANGTATASFQLAALGISDVYATLPLNPQAATPLAQAKMQTVLAIPKLTVTPAGSFLADGITAGHAVQIQVKDALGNPAASQPLTLTMSGTAGASITSANQAGISPLAVSSNANGVVDVYVSDATAEAVTLTATATDGTTVTSQAIQFIAANAAKINVTALPSTAKPDGITSIVATATVTDINNIAVPNAQVRFYTSDPNVNLSLSTALTSATGVATVNLTSFQQVLAADVYASLSLNGAIVNQTPITFVEPVTSVLLVADTLRARADGAAAITLKARTLSAAGQPLVGRTVAFAHTSFATFSTPALTDIYGETTVTVTDNSVENVTITASSEAIASAAQTLNFVPVVGSVSMAVIPVAANIPANGTSQASITATVLDKAGVALSGQVVSFRNVNASSALVSAFSATTNAAGQATISLTDTTNEPVTIQAQADIYTASSTVNFVLANYNLNVTSAASATCMGTGTAIGPCLANGSAQTINVTVNSTTTGLAQPGQPFNVAANGSAIALPSLITTASVNPYQASFTLADTAAELVTISLTDAAGVVSTRTVQFVSATANSVVLNADVLSLVPDGVTLATVSATVKDSAGGAVANALVYFSTTDPYAVLSATQGLTNAAGVATATVRSSTETVSPITARLPLNGAATNTLNIAFEAPVNRVALLADTANLGVNASATLTATVLDAAARPLAGRTVTFATTGVATFSSVSGVSDAYGNVQVTLQDSTAQAVTVSASVGAKPSLPLTITFTPLVGTMNLSVLPSSGAVPADGTSTGTIVVNLKDPYGSPIFGQSVQFLDDKYTSSVQISAATAITDATGTATITVKDVYAESVTIRAIAGGQSKTGTVNFTLTNLQFVVGGAMPFLADGIQDHYVTVQASDKLGNPTAAQVFQVTTASQTMIPSQTQITTDANGFAQVSVSDYVAETANVTFSDGAALSFAVPVQFVAADPYSLSIFVTPATGVNPNGITPATITVFVKDQYGAAVSNAWVALNTTGAAATLAGGNILSNLSGIATTTITSTTAGTTTITASTPRNPTVTTVSAPVIFETPVAAVTLAADLLTVDAYGTANVASTITATVRDATGAVITGRAVSFTITSGQGTLTTLTGTTSATGTLNTKLYSAVGGVVQITASAGAVTSAPIAVTFVPIANTVNITVAPNTQSVVADGVSTAIVTVNVKDSYGVPIAGQTVRFYDDSFSSAVLSATVLTTNAGGIAALTVSDPVIEAVSIRAVVGSNAASWKQVSTTLQFVNSNIQLIVSGAQPFLADSTPHPLNLLVKDQYGVAITTPQAFILSSSTATMIPAQLQVSTDATGNATVNVQDSLTETATLTLTHIASGLVFSVPVQFVSAAANAMQVNVTPTTGVLPDGISVATATVIVTDAYGAVVPNALVQFDVKNALGAIDVYATLSASTAITNATGRAIVTVSRKPAGTTTLNVSLPRNTAIATQAIGINFAGQVAQTPAKISLSASAYTLNSDGSDRVTLTALVKDTSNVGVAGSTVSFTPTSTGDAGVLSNNTAITDAYGQAQITLGAGTFDRSNRIINVVANVGALAPTPVVPITVSGSTVTAAVSNSSLVADGTASSNIVATLKDSGGNPVPFVSVSGAVTVGNNIGLTVDVYSGAQLMMSGIGGTWIGDSYTTTDTSGNVTFDVYASGSVGGGDIIITLSALGATGSVNLTPSLSGDVFSIILPVKGSNPVMALYGRQAITIASSGAVRQAALDLYTQGLKADPYAYVKMSSTSGLWASTVGGALTVDPYIIVPFNFNTPYTAIVDFYGNLPGTINIQADEYVATATTSVGYANDSMLLSVNATTPARINVTSLTSTVAPSLAGLQNSTSITATVVDANNFAVSNIPVTFSIISGPGGGEYMTPVTGFTDAGGNVTSTFNSGSLPSAVNGITVAASVFSGKTITGTTKMTIGQSAVSVSLGTSSVIASSQDGTSYILPMSALVTDINGSAVPGMTVTLRVRPVVYAYGFRQNQRTASFLTGDVSYWPGYNFDTAGYSSTLVNVTNLNASVVNTAIGFGAEDRNNNQVLDFVTAGAPEDGYTKLYNYQSPLSGEITDIYTSYTYYNYSNGSLAGTTLPRVAQPLVNLDAIYAEAVPATVPITYVLTSYQAAGYISKNANGSPSCERVTAAQFTNITGTLPSWYCSPMADGSLTPAHASAGSVPSSAVTGADGLAQFNLTYQKQYARWLTVEVSATIQNTAGTESNGKITFQLSESISDTNLNMLAAYPVSPFGAAP